MSCSFYCRAQGSATKAMAGQESDALPLCRHFGIICSACLDSERQHCLPSSITNVRCLYTASQAIEIFRERCLEENPLVC